MPYLTFKPSRHFPDKLVPTCCGETLKFGAFESACAECGQRFSTLDVMAAHQAAVGEPAPSDDVSALAAILTALVFQRPAFADVDASKAQAEAAEALFKAASK